MSVVRAAGPGSRHETLLRQAGRLRVRADRGGLSRSSAYEQLLGAALESGLTAAEARKVLDWSFKQPKSTSPAGGRTEGPRTRVVTKVTERELNVLGAICAAFTARSAEYGVPYERQSSDIFSLRWVCKHTGLRHQEQARRSIEKLIAAGLLWRNPYPKLLKEGQRPCDRYRPTYAGLAVSGCETETAE